MASCQDQSQQMLRNIRHAQFLAQSYQAINQYVKVMISKTKYAQRGKLNQCDPYVHDEPLIM